MIDYSILILIFNLKNRSFSLCCFLVDARIKCWISLSSCHPIFTISFVLWYFWSETKSQLPNAVSFITKLSSSAVNRSSLLYYQLQRQINMNIRTYWNEPCLVFQKDVQLENNNVTHLLQESPSMTINSIVRFILKITQ